MTPEQRVQLRELLTAQRILAISVLVDGEPYAGLLPYVFVPEDGAVLVHASQLARHTRGFTPGAPFSTVVHQPDRPGADPLQIPRVTLQGVVELVDKPMRMASLVSGYTEGLWAMGPQSQFI